MPVSRPNLVQRAAARGMTILELGVVIVVLGTAMLMAMRGLELWDLAKAFVVSNQVEQIRQNVSAYQAEYSALPGSDIAAAGRWGLPEPTSTLGGASVSYMDSQRLHGKLSDVLDANGEQFMAWRHLRAARLMDGDPAVAGASAAPENPFGGIYGFDEGNLGQVNGSLCATRVPGRAAETIDARLDDGKPGKGLVVATARFDPAGALNHFDAPDSGAYNYEKTYIICLPMLP